jgi:stage 0 sporulation protein B (sporulation initiation phosphotransferase)
MKQAEEPMWQGRELDEQRQLWIDTISHARHDWLNDLQLIIGYVQLRKYDKLAECVGMLKQRIAEEGRAVKLGHPGLVEAFLTYKTKPRPFVFELQIQETIDFRNFPHAADAVESAARRLLEGFEASAAKGILGSDNELVGAFDCNAEEATLQFTYRGVYTENVLRKTVVAIQKQMRASSVSIVVEASYDVSAAEVTVRVPISG